MAPGCSSSRKVSGLTPTAVFALATPKSPIDHCNPPPFSSPPVFAPQRLCHGWTAAGPPRCLACDTETTCMPGRGGYIEAQGTSTLFRAVDIAVFDCMSGAYQIAQSHSCNAMLVVQAERCCRCLQVYLHRLHADGQQRLRGKDFFLTSVGHSYYSSLFLVAHVESGLDVIELDCFHRR
jgi:hypothetical protein